jgi:hypothetical protein
MSAIINVSIIVFTIIILLFIGQLFEIKRRKKLKVLLDKYYLYHDKNKCNNELILNKDGAPFEFKFLENEALIRNKTTNETGKNNSGKYTIQTI